MKNIHDLTYWTVSRLEGLTSQSLLDLARQAFSGLTTARLLMGRCLLAMKRTQACQLHGYSGDLHFSNWSGVDIREASEARRVAERLETLPRLRAAAESGKLPWAQAREIVRKASEETEERWLDLASRCSYKEIEKLVARTQEGELPAEPDRHSQEAELSELRVWLPSAVVAMIQQAVRDLSHEDGRLVPMAEVIEFVFAEYLAGGGVPSRAARDKVKARAHQDVEAARERESREWSQVSDDPHGSSSFERGGVDDEDQPDPHGSPGSAAPWVALAAAEDAGPHEAGLQLLSRARPHWSNPRLAYSAPQRAVTSAQRRELLRRDGYQCATPGCPNHLWLDVHHVVFYCRGGVTIPDNLVICCRACHRNIHRGLLKVSGRAPGELTWTDREGRNLRMGSPGRASGLGTPRVVRAEPESRPC